MSSIDHELAVTFLRALGGDRTTDQFVEVRFRRGERMRRCFFEGAQLVQAAHVALALGDRTDVYVGVAPRHGGGRTVRQAWALWVDCADAASRERLWDFAPAPSIVIRSGSPDACHAYWLLDKPLAAAAVQRANWTRASALGADRRAAHARRALRPPGTRNFSCTIPRPVELERFVLHRYTASSVLRGGGRESSPAT